MILMKFNLHFNPTLFTFKRSFQQIFKCKISEEFCARRGDIYTSSFWNNFNREQLTKWQTTEGMRLFVRSTIVNLINDITLIQRRFSSYRRKVDDTINKLKTDVQYFCKWFLSLST